MNRKTWVMLMNVTLLAFTLVSCAKVTIKEPADTAADTVGEVTEPADTAADTVGEVTEPADTAADTAGESTEPADRVTEPANEDTEQTDNATEPAGNAAEPASKDGEPAGGPTGPAGKAPELSDDDVLELYFIAREAYEWFDMTTIPFDSEKYFETDNRPYYEVVQKDITSKQALTDYLNGIFADDITDRLMSESSERFAEHGGKLYVMPADRGTDIFKGAESYEIFRSSDTEIKITVTVEVFEDFEQENIAGYEKYDFFLELSDNLWRFKNFELVR
jgi:hypothetical protein